MKKRTTAEAFVIFFALLFLSSCALIPGYSEPEDRAVVSAIGFDIEGDVVRVTMLTAPTETSEGKVLTGVGNSIETAVSHLLSKQWDFLEAEHCAVAVLGNGADEGWIDKILNYFSRNGGFSPSMCFISTPDAGLLLSSEGLTGYDLTAAISKEGEIPGIDSVCRLYRLKNALLTEDPLLLPHFYSNDDEAELYGSSLIINGGGSVTLNRAESAYYMMLCGLYRRGVLSGDGSEISVNVGVADCRTEYYFSEGVLEILLKIEPDRELGGREHAEELQRHTEKKITELYNDIWRRYGDVFGFSRVLSQLGANQNKPNQVTIKCEIRGN